MTGGGFGTNAATGGCETGGTTGATGGCHCTGGGGGGLGVTVSCKLAAGTATAFTTLGLGSEPASFAVAPKPPFVAVLSSTNARATRHYRLTTCETIPPETAGTQRCTYAVC